MKMALPRVSRQDVLWGGEIAPPMLPGPAASGASSQEEVTRDPSKTAMSRETLRSKGRRRISMARIVVWRGDIPATFRFAAEFSGGWGTERRTGEGGRGFQGILRSRLPRGWTW